jgi:HEPN domain-containing protein
MKNKQTAVEFYRTEFSALLSMKESKFQTENEIFDQAKQMEKEQILDSWDDGYSCGMYQEGLGNDYYNETYLGIIKEKE